MWLYDLATFQFSWARKFLCCAVTPIVRLVQKKLEMRGAFLRPKVFICVQLLMFFKNGTKNSEKNVTILGQKNTKMSKTAKKCHFFIILVTFRIFHFFLSSLLVTIEKSVFALKSPFFKNQGPPPPEYFSKKRFFVS